ncbi:MAG TPA: phosphate ABC transporter, permease protein PstA, partial [Bacteroidia bacterium]|nr:phosphate ABC transporter, permease protein PstA [Bacteroidia bacterium]
MTKQTKEYIAFWIFRILSVLVIGVLFWILEFIFVRGWHMLSWDFLTKMPEDGMTKGGIYPAIIGTLCLVAGSMIFAFPIGVLAGIYIHEYTNDSWFKRFMKLMTNNLA